MHANHSFTRRTALALALAALLALPLAGCFGLGGSGSSGGQGVRREPVQSQEIQFTRPVEGDTIAVIETSLGTIRAVLFPDKAPQACDNFIGLAQGGYYNGLSFTRVESGFSVEAGQNAQGTATTIWNGNGYPAEVTDALHHYSGALCAAMGEDGLAKSVFYFMQTLPGSVDEELMNQMAAQGFRQEVMDAYAAAGGAPYLDYTDTVFGQVYEGMEVVDAIAAVELDETGRPVEAVTIQSVAIGTYTAPVQ